MTACSGEGLPRGGWGNFLEQVEFAFGCRDAVSLEYLGDFFVRAGARGAETVVGFPVKNFAGERCSINLRMAACVLPFSSEEAIVSKNHLSHFRVRGIA